MMLSQLLSMMRHFERSTAFSRMMEYLFHWTKPPFWNLLGKVGIYVRTFYAGYRLPTTDFLTEVFSQASQCLRTSFIFSIASEKFTFYTGKNARVLVPDGKSSLENWKNHWSWVNSFTVVPEEFPECILAGMGMSTERRRPQEHPKFFVTDGRERKVLPFSDVLGWKFQGDLLFKIVSLCKNLAPPRYKYAQGFAILAVLMPSRSTTIGETPSLGNPLGAPLVVISPPIPSKSLEHVEDNK
ncbi:unnamed protein product [Lactuca saligna]|uniref:Uncharacterized protein n=1 Tax=Lactuca saligna TaxID=75948 RepID=A0AA35VDQ9_LACSI|nr:unnamed protein product [Lactuca saligna]